MRYGPSEGLHVYMRSPQEAMRHTRRTMNIPDHVGLGWTPYTIIVTSHGGTLAHTAFHSTKDLRRWLGGGFRVQLGYWRFLGFRGGKVVAARERSR